MKAAMICFSLTGCATGMRLQEVFEMQGMDCVLDKKSKYLEDSIKVSTKEWAKEQFENAEALIFIGACGIAVRSIAPYVENKKKDPAVLVVDECGKYVISLLSGHLGGANELAQIAAQGLGAQSIVTTATDLHGRFAVDVFAKKNHCEIKNMTAAKEVSAALLAGENVGFYSEFPWEGTLPAGVVLCDADGKSCEEHEGDREKNKPFSLGIAVTTHTGCAPFLSTVSVIPKIYSLGAGCKKGKEAACVLTAAQAVLKDNDLYREAFFTVASIDLKKEEQGILALAQSWEIPFVTYSAQELRNVPGEFTPSAFVNGITGVDNVCERSAVLAAGNGTLIQKKRSGDGVTTAVAAAEWRIHFE